MIGTLYVTLTTSEALQKDALAMIVRWLCERDVKPLNASEYAKRLAEAKVDLRGSVQKLADWLKEAFTLRLAIQTHKAGYPGMAEDLAALMPPDFLRHLSFERVKHLPRYLKGMLARAERFKRDTAKDAQRAKELAPFVAAVRKLGDRGDDVRWLVEEFRVSLFAQELGTAEPVSAVRLERALAEINGGKSKDTPTPAAPAVVPVTAAKKSTPLKSLGALDQLFRK
jgi:ATP-dependent helicase HrpA